MQSGAEPAGKAVAGLWSWPSARQLAADYAAVAAGRSAAVLMPQAHCCWEGSGAGVLGAHSPRPSVSEVLAWG